MFYFSIDSYQFLRIFKEDIRFPLYGVLSRGEELLSTSFFPFFRYALWNSIHRLMVRDQRMSVLCETRTGSVARDGEFIRDFWFGEVPWGVRLMSMHFYRGWETLLISWKALEAIKIWVNNYLFEKIQI